MDEKHDRCGKLQRRLSGSIKISTVKNAPRVFTILTAPGPITNSQTAPGQLSLPHSPQLGPARPRADLLPAARAPAVGESGRARGGAYFFGRTDAHSCASSQQLTPPLAFPDEIHSDNGQYCELCNA